MFSFSLPWLLGFFPLDSLFSTQGIMVMLLVAYGGAMWMFLSSAGDEGLWYQLKKNAQLHIVSGANLGHKNRQRHVCFDHACLEELLLRIQTRGIKHKIRRDRPLNFLVKDIEGRVLEIAEVSS